MKTQLKIVMQGLKEFIIAWLKLILYIIVIGAIAIPPVAVITKIAVKYFLTFWNLIQ
jgi:hypothetical protein